MRLHENGKVENVKIYIDTLGKIQVLFLHNFLQPSFFTIEAQVDKNDMILAFLAFARP